MDIRSVWTQEAGTVAGITRAVAVLSAQTQAAAQANDPSAAYLLTLSDPGAIIRAAEAQAALRNVGTAGAAQAVVAANALRSAALTGTGAAAVVQAAGTVAAGTADLYTYAQATAQAAQAGTADLVREPAAGAETTGAATADQDQVQNQASPRDAIADRMAEDLAALAAQTAALNAYTAASTASSVAQAASGLATDATAKYMGAGALALNQGPGSAAAQAAAAYRTLQEIIPAVIATPSSPPLSANAESTRQGRTPANPALPPMRRVTGREAVPFQALDLTG